MIQGIFTYLLIEQLLEDIPSLQSLIEGNKKFNFGLFFAKWGGTLLMHMNLYQYIEENLK